MKDIMVTPLAGVWIEIVNLAVSAMYDVVVPHTGAWVEIRHTLQRMQDYSSLPWWERGLKRDTAGRTDCRVGRSPRGSAD